MNNGSNSRECLSLLKDKINHDDSTSNADIVSNHNTVNHDDIFVPKGDFNSYRVKCMKDL